MKHHVERAARHAQFSAGALHYSTPAASGGRLVQSSRGRRLEVERLPLVLAHHDRRRVTCERVQERRILPHLIALDWHVRHVGRIATARREGNEPAEEFVLSQRPRPTSAVWGKSAALASPCGTVVLVPQLVPELVGRIEAPLQCEEFAPSRVGTEELRLRGVKLVQKIVRSPNAQSGVNQFPCPDPDFILSGRTRALLVVNDKREDLRARPGQERPGSCFAYRMETFRTFTSWRVNTSRMRGTNSSKRLTGTNYSSRTYVEVAREAGSSSAVS